MEKTLIERLKYDSDSMTDCRHCMYQNENECPDVECHEGVILKFCEELKRMKKKGRKGKTFFEIENQKIYNAAINEVIAKIKGGQNGNV